MYLYKLIVLVTFLVTISSAAIEHQEDLEAEETQAIVSRQKRAPVILKKLLLGGLLSKKALILGGGAGVIGGSAAAAALSHKLSRNDIRYPMHNINAPTYPVRPPLNSDQYPPAPVYPVRPHYDQHDRFSIGVHLQKPVYISSGYHPSVPDQPTKVDCYQ